MMVVDNDDVDDDDGCDNHDIEGDPINAGYK